MSQEICIIDENEDVFKKIKLLITKDNKMKIKFVKIADIESMLKNIPDVIVINDDEIKDKTIEICKQIRDNEDNSITPIIVISSNKDYDYRIAIMKNEVEYFAEKSFGMEYLSLIIKNIARLMEVNRTVSPLTKLPGNVQIHTELKKRLLRKQEFSVLYFDLDNFKAYNDVYGFLKGDEIIKFSARMITENVHKLENKDCFVGHIGGDDFVAILEGTEDIDFICQNIIAQFDLEIEKYFTDEDWENGFIKVQNRKGKIEEFPLTAISIGVVIADNKKFSNILEIGEVGAQVKHLAKTTQGSSYAINRRNE